MTNAQKRTQEVRTVDVEVGIAAPPKRVFNALTDPKTIQSWWSTRAHVEAKKGGRYMVAFEFDDESKNMTQDVRVTAIEAPARLAFTWKNPLPGDDSHVDIRLTPRDVGTRLTLVHDGFGHGPEWDAYVEKIREGWNYYLGNLKSVLEDGKDQRRGTGMVLAQE